MFVTTPDWEYGIGPETTGPPSGGSSVERLSQPTETTCLPARSAACGRVSAWIRPGSDQVAKSAKSGDPVRKKRSPTTPCSAGHVPVSNVAKLGPVVAG